MADPAAFPPHRAADPRAAGTRQARTEGNKSIPQQSSIIVEGGYASADAGIAWLCGKLKLDYWSNEL